MELLRVSIYASTLEKRTAETIGRHKMDIFCR